MLHAVALFALFLLPIPPARPLTDSFTWDVQIVQPAPEPSAAVVAASEPAISQPPPSTAVASHSAHATQAVTRQVRTISSKQQQELKQVQVVSAPSPQFVDIEQQPVQQAPAVVHRTQPLESTDAPQEMTAAVTRNTTRSPEREAVVSPQSVPVELVNVQGTQIQQAPAVVHRTQPLQSTDAPQETTTAVSRNATPSPGRETVVSPQSVPVELANVQGAQMIVKSEEVRATAPSAATPLESRVPVQQRVVEDYSREAEVPVLNRPAEVTTVASRVVASSQAHYGWLKDELRAHIERVKHYPQQALDRKWEGRVIVRAVIWADGRLTDLSVVESSGYDTLDREALDLLQRLSPLALNHALGVPQIALRIPISYGIK